MSEMTKRERKYHQSKKWAKKRPLIFLKRRRGGFDIGVHKDRAHDYLGSNINYQTATPESYDAVRMKRFWHDEFSQWDTGKPIRINSKEYFELIMKKAKK